MINADEQRVELGAKLKEMRIAKGLSAYRVAKDGDILIPQVKTVESGKSNYTIDLLFSYLAGCKAKFDLNANIFQ